MSQLLLLGALAVALPLQAQNQRPVIAPSLLEGLMLETRVELQDLSNASGLTYDSTSDTVVLVLDSPATLVVLKPDGSELRRVSLRGFEDTEGVAHLDSHTFAVVEEGRHSVSFVELASGTELIHRPRSGHVVVGSPSNGNQGLEGLAFASEQRTLFSVKELKRPMVYKIALSEEHRATKVTIPFKAKKLLTRTGDLSGIHYVPASKRLLLLSHEDQVVVEVDMDGREINRLSLTEGSGGLAKDIRKAEGITMDSRGRLFICGEPNELVIFSPERAGLE